MFSTLTTLYSVYSYVDDGGTLARILKTLKMYSRFVIFYLRNPEVQIKYIRKMNGIETDENILQDVKTTISDEGFRYNNITEGKNDLNFSLKESNLDYRIVRDEHEKITNLLVETNYTSFYPMKSLGRLKEVTSTFNEICESISNNYRIENQKRTIIAEFVVERRKNQKEIGHSQGKVVFDEEGFQVTECYCDNKADFLFYLSLKWLMESENPDKILD
jgi:hypothetical protein